MRRFEKFLLWINITLVIVTLLSYLAPVVNPQEVWQIGFLGLGYPVLLASNLAFIGIWALARKKHILLSLITLFVGFNGFDHFFSFNTQSVDLEKIDNRLNVLTFNARSLQEVRRNKTQPQKRKAYSELKKKMFDEELDIVCLQEFSGYLFEKFQDSIFLPNYVHLEKINAIIASKYPILENGGGKFKNSGNGFIWADIKTAVDTIRVINVHLQSNQVSGEASDVLSTKVQEKATFKKIRPLLHKIKKNTIRRVDQANFIQQMVLNSPHPVLLSGDFNDTPQSYIYSILTEKLNDSFEATGWGIGTTYKLDIPGLRIDYILADPNFIPKYSEVLDWEYSDHYPVKSTFQFGP